MYSISFKHLICDSLPHSSCIQKPTLILPQFLMYTRIHGSCTYNKRWILPSILLDQLLVRIFGKWFQELAWSFVVPMRLADLFFTIIINSLVLVFGPWVLHVAILIGFWHVNCCLVLCYWIPQHTTCLRTLPGVETSMHLASI